MTQLEVYVLHFVYQQESFIACNLEPMIGRYIYENDVRISKTLLEYTVYLKSCFCTPNVTLWKHFVQN